MEMREAPRAQRDWTALCGCPNTRTKAGLVRVFLDREAARLICMAKSIPTAAVIADNLRRLMSHFGLSQAELGRRAGVAQTMLSGLLRREHGVKNPRANTIDKLAAHFKIAPWKLLIPDVEVEILLDDQIERLVEAYVKTPSIGRENVRRIAEAEMRYGALADAPGESP